MKIAYDISILEGSQLTGVEKLALNLFEACWEAAPEDEHFLFCRKHPEHLKDLPPQCSLIVTGESNLWRWLKLPYLLKNHNCDAFISGVTNTTLPCGVALYPYVHECQWRYKTNEKSAFRHRVALWFNAFFSRSIFCNSEYTASDIRKDLPFKRKVFAVPPSFDKSIIEYPPMSRSDLCQQLKIPDGEYFLFLSSVRPKKNIPLLIESFSHPEMQKKRLLIAGKILHPEIAESAAHMENVHFLDYVPNNLTSSLYKNATAFLYVSLNEGFGLPILEAYKMRTPVIASNCGSIPEVAGNAALYVSGHDADELTQAILGFSTKDNFLKESQMILQKYSWEASAQKLLKIIKNK